MSINTTKVTKEVIEIADICCNICQQSCNKQTITYDEGPSQNNYEYAEVSATWGYFSSKDLTTYSAHICEDCFDKHLAPLIKFDVEGYNLA